MTAKGALTNKTQKLQYSKAMYDKMMLFHQCSMPANNNNNIHSFTPWSYLFPSLIQRQLCLVPVTDHRLHVQDQDENQSPQD